MKRFSFKPRLIPTIATLLLLPLLLSLGFWQLSRADEKKVIQTDINTRSVMPPLSLAQLNTKKGDLRYYPVRLSGRFDNQHQILLDNKVHQRQVGYEVITPLIVANNKVVLINRGWIHMGQSRRQLPTIKPVQQPVTLSGRIYIPHEKPFILSSRKNTAVNWPLRVQAIDIPQISKLLQRPVEPYIVQLSPRQPYGFVREWKAINMKPEKHIGYAVQWFALAGVLVVIFVALNFRKRKPTK